MALSFDVQIVGDALNTQLVAFDTIEGLGLNTFGFLWPIDGIWGPCCDPITLTWEDCDC
jgi:hypothetical protein